MKVEWEQPMIPSFITPQSEIINALDLEPGSIVLEYGPGGGQFTLPIARKLDELSGDGVIFAVAEELRALKALDDRAVNQDLDHRIRFLPASLESNAEIPMKNKGVDRILTVDIDFQSNQSAMVIEELERVLKPGGRIVASATKGTTSWDQVTPQEEAEHVAKMLGAAGFQTLRLMRPSGTAWAITAWK
jgi:cyclopropane fatty-acyl-phospholipid synthase-like methyltransferase